MTWRKNISFYPQPLNSKTTFPSELVILPIILNQALICTPTPNLMAVKGGTQHSIVALSTLVTHIIIVVLEVLQLEGSVMMFIEDQVQLILLISTHYNNCFIYRWLRAFSREHGSGVSTYDNNVTCTSFCRKIEKTDHDEPWYCLSKGCCRNRTNIGCSLNCSSKNVTGPPR